MYKCLLVVIGLTMLMLCGCSDNPIAPKPFEPYDASSPPTLADPYVPADAPFVTIEKKRWGLVDGGACNSFEAASANSRAMQNAIDTLTGDGHYRLKLETGDYCLWGDSRERGKDKDGKSIYGNIVKIPSYVELDLNGSTLRLAPHDRSYTCILRVEFARNVKIFNGTLIGDRLTHDYDKENSDHYGAGIWVWASMNVELFDLVIKEITGDCITVGEISPISYNVTIRNCEISRARRDGIVATNVDGLIIRDNRIFDIHNDVPLKSGSIGAQACIAFEATKTDGTQRISNVLIEDNYLDGSSGTTRYNKLFFNSHGGSQNIILRNNVAIGSYSARYGRNILFADNKFYEGDFQLEGAVNNQYSHTGFGENFIFENNDFYNYRIGNTGGNLYDRHPDYRQNVVFIGNRFYNGDISMVSHTTYALIDNEFIHASAPNFVSERKLSEDEIRSQCIAAYVYGDPPTNNVKHEWYFVGNTMSDGWTVAKKFGAQYSGGKTITFETIDEMPNYATLAASLLPDWFYVSNNRDEALAFVDRVKWY